MPQEVGILRHQRRLWWPELSSYREGFERALSLYISACPIYACWPHHGCTAPSRVDELRVRAHCSVYHRARPQTMADSSNGSNGEHMQ